jgi:hypothetical protein
MGFAVTAVSVLGSAIAGAAANVAWGAVVSSMVSKAIIGAAIGGLTSAISGGSIAKGMLFGAIGGAVMGGFSGLVEQGFFSGISTGFSEGMAMQSGSMVGPVAPMSARVGVGVGAGGAGAGGASAARFSSGGGQAAGAGGSGIGASILSGAAEGGMSYLGARESAKASEKVANMNRRSMLEQIEAQGVRDLANLDRRHEGDMATLRESNAANKEQWQAQIAESAAGREDQRSFFERQWFEKEKERERRSGGLSSLRLA